MVGRTNPWQNDRAAIVTAARPSKSGGTVTIRTRVRYGPTRPNANGETRTGWRPGGSLSMRIASGDVSRLGQVWGKVFDLVAGVVQNSPEAIDWQLDLSELNGGDDWLRGAVQAVVHTVAHELDIDVEMVGV